MQIDPNAPAHKDIITFVQDCFKLSEKYMKQRHVKWNKCEKMDRSYIDLTETDSKGRKKNPFEQQVYIPMSRACKDTYLTYLMQVFCGKRPSVAIGATGPEDVKPAKRMEVIVDYQNERQRYPLIVYSFLNDVANYGLGSIKNLFAKEYSPVYSIEKQIMPGPIPQIVSQRVQKDVVSYEGPNYTNNDPYKFFPDPRVSIGKFQDGQFLGFEYSRSYYYLKKKEREGIYFNIDRLKDQGGESSAPFTTAETDSARDDVMGVSRPTETGDLNLNPDNPHYKIRELWVEIIPRDLFKSDEYSSYPEIWIFTIADNQLVIRADRSSYAHGKFPSVIGQHDYDPHALFTQSFYEGIEGLQDLINWLFNSHIDNVKRALNDWFVVDPFAVNIRDITKPNPMKLIRLQKSLWGKGVNLRQVIEQLPVTDVTGSHINDAMIISDMMQRRTRATDTMQGIETEVKRTATEIAKMTTGSTSTLSIWGMLLYAQSMVPLAEMTVMNNQQFLSQGRYYRILGNYAKEVQDPLNPGAIFVSPEEIQGYFDYPIHDGRLPTKPEDFAEIWTEIFKVVAQTPPLQMQFDLFAIFKEAAQSLGAKNIDDFRLKANIMPDEEIAKQAEAGNIIPLPNAMPPAGAIQ